MSDNINKQLACIEKALENSRDYFLEHLSKMICGDKPYGVFCYRSSSQLTDFFHLLELPYVHDGSTRWRWVNDVLMQIVLENGGSKNILRIYYALFEHRFNEELSVEYDEEKAKELFRKVIQSAVKESSIPNFDDNLLDEIQSNQGFDLTDDYGKNLLDKAKEKFNNGQKKDAINDLWDLFERLKTELNPQNKKRSSEELIKKMTSLTKINTDDLELRFKLLTEFGNKYNIRHHEHGKIILEEESYEFVFYEMLNFLNLVVKTLNYGNQGNQKKLNSPSPFSQT